MKSFVYDQLSFLIYDCTVLVLDTEWLLSTLFDASLLSTSKPPETAALFLGGVRGTSLETIKSLAAGLWAAGASRFLLYKAATLKAGGGNGGVATLTMRHRCKAETAFFQF